MSFSIITLAVLLAAADVPPATTLWYTAPATQWMEALPLGNGRVGAMVHGQTHHEIIDLDESTCWSGCASTENENPQTPQAIAAGRQAILAGDWEKLRQTMPQVYGRNRLSFGTHLALGRLILDVVHESKQSRNYRRQLDLAGGLASVEYDNASAGSAADAPRFRREIFVSHPDQVLVVRLTASRPASVSFNARLDGGDNPYEVASEGSDTLLLDGDAFETLHSDGQTGVHFHGRLRILAQGGTVTAQRGRLHVTGADSAVLLVALGTTFGGARPEELCRRQIQQAAAKSYEQLKQAHQEDHRRLFGRVELDLGRAPHAAWSTDRRLEAVRNGDADPGLAVLLFQYARYLLIAASREDSPLPMHIQGVWNDSRCSRMPWSCDHHLDINISMHYWPAEVGNLSECHRPLLNWVSDVLRPSGRRSARVEYGCPGWTADAVSNAWGYSACGWAGWTPFVTGGTWIASHLWSHFLYTGDKEFLARQAYPTLKENAEFFLGYLFQEPRHGWYVTGPSVSPENSFLAPDGKQTHWSLAPTADVVLVRQLLASCIAAGEILDVDREFRVKLQATLAKLPPLQIGRQGQLQEWLEDFTEAIPGHRHTCHLLAVYPFAQIDSQNTPELAQAVKTTLQRRLAAKSWEDHGWSRALVALQWARLGKAQTAYEHLQKYMGTFVYQNLLDFAWGGQTGTRYPIFCLDGNGGFATAVSEMLLASYHDEIQFLPALPKEWSTGSVRGLCAQGGFEVDEQWKSGRLARAAIRSKLGRECVIRGPLELAVTCQGAPVKTACADGLTRFATEPGRGYEILPKKPKDNRN